VFPEAQLWRFWASFPGIHIAQFPFRVIGNCGVISLMRCSNRQKLKIVAALGGWVGRNLGPARALCRGSDGRLRELSLQLAVGGAHNMTVSWRRRLARICGAAEG